MRLLIIMFSALCVAVVCAAPGLWGEEPDSEQEQPASVTPGGSATAAGVLADLTQLREEVGQNIFAGSVLDDGDTAESFESSLRTELGLPARKDSQPVGVVKSIRAETARLDVLAHELEQSRDYQHADRLRAIAQRLRLAVREIDR